MKKNLLYTCMALVIIFLTDCKEEPIGQFPVDNTAPRPVSGVVVNNIAGGAQISYQLPEEEDLLYVQAVYALPNGTTGRTKTSVFSNSMLIKGFAKSEKAVVQLVSVDRSRNESTPVRVDIEPLDSPIYEILDSLEVQESFGGFKLTWPNPLKEDIVLGVLKKNETTNELDYVENVYSSQAFVETAIRGLDSVQATFCFFIRDIYENSTDTLEMSLKPYFEEEIPKSGFAGLSLSSRFTLHSYGGKDISKLWNNVTNVDDDVYYIQTGNEIMPYFTIDMGVKAKLSRFRLWQRVNYLFALHNPKMFEWYGTNDPAAANDAETLGWEDFPAWIKLSSFESKRPSGGQEGDPVTAEDEAYAKAGEEFEFPLDAPAMRYLRFKLISTWSGSSGLHIGELTFWGQIEK